MSETPIIYDADGSIATRKALDGRTWDRPVPATADRLPFKETSKELLEEIRRTQEIADGAALNRGSEQYTGDIMGAAEFSGRTAKLVDMGRLVADPVYVKRVEWDRIQNSADNFWLFTQDLVWLFSGKRMDTLGEFFHVHLQTRNYPDIYRVMLPEPILNSGWGGAVDQSCVAMEQGDYAALLKRFIVWASFVRRYTDAQRKAVREKMGKELLDQYWETKSYTLDIRIVGKPVKFDLFLPSGMDYEMKPVVKAGKLVEFIKDKPDPLVIAAGQKVFCGDFYGVPMKQGGSVV